MLPTGFGKSMIYTLFPLVLSEIQSKVKTALVVSPLKALMADQVQILTKRGIKAAAIVQNMTQDTINEIRHGNIQVLFASPESVMLPHIIKMLRANPMNQQLCLIAFDEAHCISEWGLDFREDYRKVSDLMSFLSDIPTCLLSATLTEKIQKDLYSLLTLPEDTKVVAVLPDRPNIYIHIDKVKENHEESLQWLLEHVATYGLESKKFIVYCKTIKSCQKLYIWIMAALGGKAYSEDKQSVSTRLIDMFHAKVDEDTVQRVTTLFTQPESVVRVLFTTIAFGMGIQIDDVDVVVHWGISQTSLCYWQEVGRCARDGRQGFALTYAFPTSLNTCKDNLKTIIDSNVCNRQTLLSQFKLNDMTYEETSISKCELKCFRCNCALCLCCNKCSETCQCTGHVKHVLERVLNS